MTYESYVGMTREALLEKIASQMSEKRFKHVLSVEQTAKELAEHYGVAIEKAGLAALLHDYAKEAPTEEFFRLIDAYALDQELKKWNNNIWHGLVGVYKIQEDLGIQDEEILRAISLHTVGSSHMTDLDKIVYIADYIEPNRNFPGVDEARQLAVISLNKAVAYATARTVAHLASQAIPIYPQTLDTYNAFIADLED